MNKTVARGMSIILIAMMFISISMTCFALSPSEITGDSNVTGSAEITSLGKKYSWNITNCWYSIISCCFNNHWYKIYDG